MGHHTIVRAAVQYLDAHQQVAFIIELPQHCGKTFQQVLGDMFSGD